MEHNVRTYVGECLYLQRPILHKFPITEKQLRVSKSQEQGGDVEENGTGAGGWE